MKAKKEARVKQIIYSGFLAILGTIASVDRAIAQVQNPSESFKTFTDWCLNQEDLTPEARHTVQMLLEEAETEECDRATEILTQTKGIDLRGLHTGSGVFWPRFAKTDCSSLPNQTP